MRNKLIATSLLFIFAAGSAYAAGNNANGQWSKGDSAGTVTIDASGVGANLAAKPKVSANVWLYYKAAPTGKEGTNYSMATAHASGTKTYATSADDNRLYMKENASKNAYLAGQAATTTECAADQTVAVAPDYDATTGNVVYTGWTSVK